MRLRAGRISVGAAIATAMLMAIPTSSLAAVRVQPDIDGGLDVLANTTPDKLLVSFDPGAQRLLFIEPGITEISPTCTQAGDEVACAIPPPSRIPGLANIRISLANGGNSVTVASTVPSTLEFAISSGTGPDVIRGGPEADVIDPGEGADFVSGGGGTDSVGYAQRVTPVSVSLDGTPNSGNELDGPPGARDTLMPDVENVRGGNASDRLVGNRAPNAIAGGKGHDVMLGLGGDDDLQGGDHADRVFGGPGNDLLTGDGPGDALFGGPGIDRIDAKDKNHERVINCGPGNDRRERATRDGGDPHPISC